MLTQTVKPFQTLSVEEKAKFFVHGQKLLTQYHPDSPYIIREDNLTQLMEQVKHLSKQYQGFCYADDNICVLFNKIYVHAPGGIRIASPGPTVRDSPSISIVPRPSRMK